MEPFCAALASPAHLSRVRCEGVRAARRTCNLYCNERAIDSQEVRCCRFVSYRIVPKPQARGTGAYTDAHARTLQIRTECVGRGTGWHHSARESEIVCIWAAWSQPCGATPLTDVHAGMNASGADRTNAGSKDGRARWFNIIQFNALSKGVDRIISARPCQYLLSPSCPSSVANLF